MRHPSHGLVAILISLSLCAPVLACLWDRDTLMMERERFPSALELITGKFLRHSREFYEWRIQDRNQRLEEDPSPAIYDDLAVAYEKLGDHEKAIEVTLQKDQLFPGLYQTHANLGTFYIHSGQLERGVQSIDHAISINPDAHFGREVYQRHLVQYVLSKRVSGTTYLPLDDSERLGKERSGFAYYVLEAQSVQDSTDTNAELQNAIKGVLGMMRFGNHDSPILLEALGDLLLSRGYPEDAKRLAARAYLKASYEAKDDVRTREAYRNLARLSLSTQTVHRDTSGELSLEALEKNFADELAQANRWFDAVVDDERKWISEGRNVDKAYAQKYYNEPEMDSPSSVFLIEPPSNVLLLYWISNASLWPFVVGALAVVLIGCVRIRLQTRAMRN